MVEGRDNGEPKGFKLARIADLRDLEGGTYWPALQPQLDRLIEQAPSLGTRMRVTAIERLRGQT